MFYQICLLLSAGAMAEKIWDKLKRRFSQARSDNPANLPTGSANPKKTDWVIIDKLSFLKEYVANRPVISSLSQDNTPSSTSQSDANSFSLIREEQLQFRQPQTVVKNRTSNLRAELSRYAVDLPAVNPELDRTGVRNKQKREKVLTQVKECQKSLQDLEESVKEQMENPKARLFSELLGSQIELVAAKERPRVCLEVKTALKSLRDTLNINGEI